MKTRRIKRGRPQESVAQVVSPARVVVVFRNVELRERVADALRKGGHEVLVAGSTEEFYDHVGTFCLEHGHPDLIVTAVRAHGWSGLDLLTFLEDTTWKIPILVLTPKGDAVTRLRAHRLGATAALAESFKAFELRSTVRELLRSARRRSIQPERTRA